MIAYVPDTMETITTYIMVFLAFPFFIGLVFFVHELGHYYAARFFNTRVERFSIGMGWKIWERADSKGTLWRLCLIPFAGHVTISNKKSDPDSFSRKKTWQQIVIIAAGPLTNIVFSVFLLSFSAFAIGVPSYPPNVSGVEIDGPADEAGFEHHDKILRFNGETVSHYEEISDVTEKVTGTPFDFLIERNGETKELTVTSRTVPYKNEDLLPREKGMIGISIVHEGLNIETIHEINGINVKHDTDKAREVLKAFLGKNIIIGINTFGDEMKYYRTKIIPEYNQGLFSDDKRENTLVFIGPQKGNFLRSMGPFESLTHGTKETGRITYGFLYIFGQVFRGQAFVPDISKITPTATIKHKKSEHQAISLLYLTAMFSILIALINLLPFPIFDGGQILRVILIHRHHKKRNRSLTTE